MCCDPLAPGFGLLHADGNFFFGELAGFARHAGDRFTRKVDLQRIHPVLGKHADASAHFLGAADDCAERELGLWQVRQRAVAEAAGYRDFLAGGQVARADDGTVVDGVADHHV